MRSQRRMTNPSFTSLYGFSPNIETLFSASSWSSHDSKLCKQNIEKESPEKDKSPKQKSLIGSIDYGKLPPEGRMARTQARRTVRFGGFDVVGERQVIVLHDTETMETGIAY